MTVVRLFEGVAKPFTKAEVRSLSEIPKQANLTGSTLILQLDTRNTACHTDQMNKYAAANGLYWSVPKGSAYVFLSNSAHVANTLERAPFHDESSYQAVADKVTLAHYRDLAQMAKASDLVSGGVVSRETAQTLALVALRNTVVAPALAACPGDVQCGHRAHVSDLPLLYPACVARRVPTHEWKKPHFRTVLDKEWNKLRTVR